MRFFVLVGILVLLFTLSCSSPTDPDSDKAERRRGIEIEWADTTGG